MREEITFTNARGYELKGHWEVPDSATEPLPAVVFSHGFGSSKDSSRNAPIARALLERGIIAFRFDYTGHGDSGGSQNESTIAQQTDDLMKAIDYARSRPECSELIGIAGASSGALPALNIAINEPMLGAIVLRGPRCDDLVDEADQIKAPTRIIIGGNDPLQADSRALHARLITHKSLVPINRAGHLFEEPGAMDRVVELTVEWFVEYLVRAPVVV